MLEIEKILRPIFREARRERSSEEEEEWPAPGSVDTRLS